MCEQTGFSRRFGGGCESPVSTGLVEPRCLEPRDGQLFRVRLLEAERGSTGELEDPREQDPEARFGVRTGAESEINDFANSLSGDAMQYERFDSLLRGRSIEVEAFSRVVVWLSICFRIDATSERKNRLVSALSSRTTPKSKCSLSM